MKLKPAEVREFYELMWDLQHFVNQQTKLVPRASSVKEVANLSKQDKMVLRAELFEHPAYLQQYADENPSGLGPDSLELVLSWRHFVWEDFYIERILKKHAIFIRSNKVYGVLGLADELHDAIDRRRLPIYVKAILLPFRGRIVYDGILESYRLQFGSGIASELKETYMAAKQNQGIVLSLGSTAANSVDITPVLSRDWGPEIAEVKSIVNRLRTTREDPAIWRSVFSLLRACADFAELASQEPDALDDLWDANNKVVSALQRAQTVLRRAEM